MRYESNILLIIMRSYHKVRDKNACKLGNVPGQGSHTAIGHEVSPRIPPQPPTSRVSQCPAWRSADASATSRPGPRENNINMFIIGQKYKPGVCSVLIN